MMYPPKFLGLTVTLAALFMMGHIMAALANDGDLYRARTIVTGQSAENRGPAVAVCLRDVLVKVSGDPRLIRDPRVAALAEDAIDFADGFEYLDRMAGIQIHDEQGSRDRAFYLTVSFNVEKIDAVLKMLGRTPWRGTRPRIAVFLAVKNNEIAYALADDGARGRDQRDSLAAASWQMGMPIALPKQAVLDQGGLTFATLSEADTAQLDAVAKSIGGDVALAGRLEWNTGALGWIADWRLPVQGKTYRWHIRDVNFDDAFRSAMRGVAQILSGNGAPD